MANVDTNEEFWGITLSKENKIHSWNPEEDEEDIEHKIQVTQACLGVKAKEGERNVIEVTTEDDNGKKMSCAVVSLRVGFTECMHLELGFTNPVKFVLKEGNGPISLCGVHLSALPLDFNNENDEDSSDEGEESVFMHGDEDEEFPSLEEVISGGCAKIEEITDDKVEFLPQKDKKSVKEPEEKKEVVEEKKEVVEEKKEVVEEKKEVVEEKKEAVEDKKVGEEKEVVVAKKRALTEEKEDKETVAPKKKKEEAKEEEEEDEDDDDDDDDEDMEDDDDDDDEDDEDDEDEDDIDMDDIDSDDMDSDDEDDEDDSEDEEEEEEAAKPVKKQPAKVNGVPLKKDAGKQPPKAKPTANKENVNTANKVATPKAKNMKDTPKKDSATPKKTPDELKTFLLKSPNLPKKFEKFTNFLKNNVKVTDAKVQKEMWEFVQKNKK